MIFNHRRHLDYDEAAAALTDAMLSPAPTLSDSQIDRQKAAMFAAFRTGLAADQPPSTVALADAGGEYDMGWHQASTQHPVFDRGVTMVDLESIDPAKAAQVADRVAEAVTARGVVRRRG